LLVPPVAPLKFIGKSSLKFLRFSLRQFLEKKLSVRADFLKYYEAEGRAKMARRVAGRTHCAYLCLKSVRIFSKTFTILEIADSQAGALATPPPVASTLWAKFKFAESRRNKKNEEKRKN
jgi:hypothetical protein